MISFCCATYDQPPANKPSQRPPFEAYNERLLTSITDTHGRRWLQPIVSALGREIVQSQEDAGDDAGEKTACAKQGKGTAVAEAASNADENAPANSQRQGKYSPLAW